MPGNEVLTGAYQLLSLFCGRDLVHPSRDVYRRMRAERRAEFMASGLFNEPEFACYERELSILPKQLLRMFSSFSGYLGLEPVRQRELMHELDALLHPLSRIPLTQQTVVYAASAIPK